MWLGSQDLKPPARVIITIFVPDLNRVLTEQSTRFNIFGELSCSWKIGVFNLQMKKTISARSIKLYCHGYFFIHGHPGLVSLSTAIVTGHHSFCGTIMGHPVFCTVGRA